MATRHGATTVTLPSDTVILITRCVEKPRPLVWDALTHPAAPAALVGSARALRSRFTQLPNVPSLIPNDRATSAIWRSSSSTIATASRRNSGGYFDGLPGRRFFDAAMDSSYVRSPLYGGVRPPAVLDPYHGNSW